MWQKGKRVVPGSSLLFVFLGCGRSLWLNRFGHARSLFHMAEKEGDGEYANPNGKGNGYGKWPVVFIWGLAWA